MPRLSIILYRLRNEARTVTLARSRRSRRRGVGPGEEYSDPHALAGRRADVEPGLGILAKRLRDHRAQLARPRPGLARSEADSVVGDHHPAAVRLDQAVERDRAAVAARKGVL